MRATQNCRQTTGEYTNSVKNSTHRLMKVHTLSVLNGQNRKMVNLI